MVRQITGQNDYFRRGGSKHATNQFGSQKRVTSDDRLVPSCGSGSELMCHLPILINISDPDLTLTGSF